MRKFEANQIAGFEDIFLSCSDKLAQSKKNTAQGAGRVVDLPKKYTDTNSCIFWCKMTLGTTFTKGVLPVVGEPKSKKNLR